MIEIVARPCCSVAKEGPTPGSRLADDSTRGGLVGRNTARAYPAAGAIDPAYGVDGIASFFASGQFEGPTAIDTQGRRYLGVDHACRAASAGYGVCTSGIDMPY